MDAIYKRLDQQANKSRQMFEQFTEKLNAIQLGKGIQPKEEEGKDTTVSNIDYKFNAGDVGYFHPFYDNKSCDTAPHLETAGKDTYFRDVYSFVERCKEVGRYKKDIQKHLHGCLRGAAMEWHTVELTPDERLNMTYHLDIWTRALISRFKSPPSVGVKTLHSEKYTMDDAANRREPREYAMTIMRAAKIANFKMINELMQFIYYGLDEEFQLNIDEPHEGTDLNSFLKALDNRKHQWWAIAQRHRQQARGQGNRQPQRQNNNGYTPNRGQGQGQYQNQYPRQQSGYPQQQYQQGYRNNNNYGQR